jgi:hypothetical protein
MINLQIFIFICISSSLKRYIFCPFSNYNIWFSNVDFRIFTYYRQKLFGVGSVNIFPSLYFIFSSFKHGLLWAEFFDSERSQLLIFPLMDCAFRIKSKNSLSSHQSQRFSSLFKMVNSTSFSKLFCLFSSLSFNINL